LRLNPIPPATLEYLQEITLPILVIGLVYCLVLYIGDVYDFQQDYRQVMNFGRVLIFCWAGGLVAALIVYFPYKSAFIGRTLLIILTATFSILVAFWRLTFSTIALPQRLERAHLTLQTGRDLLGALAIPGTALCQWVYG
jgi:hypothetical protein